MPTRSWKRHGRAGGVRPVVLERTGPAQHAIERGGHGVARLAAGHVVCESPRERAIETAEIDDAIGQFVLRHAEPCARPVRTQPCAHHPREAGRPHAHGARGLSGEEHGGLRACGAIRRDLDERIGRVDDDLGVPVGRNRLGRNLVRGAFEKPEPIDERPQRGRRRKFAIHHGGMILRGARVAVSPCHRVTASPCRRAPVFSGTPSSPCPPRAARFPQIAPCLRASVPPCRTALNHDDLRGPHQ